MSLAHCVYLFALAFVLSLEGIYADEPISHLEPPDTSTRDLVIKTIADWESEWLAQDRVAVLVVGTELRLNDRFPPKSREFKYMLAYDMASGAVRIVTPWDSSIADGYPVLTVLEDNLLRDAKWISTKAPNRKVTTSDIKDSSFRTRDYIINPYFAVVSHFGVATDAKTWQNLPALPLNLRSGYAGQLKGDLRSGEWHVPTPSNTLRYAFHTKPFGDSNVVERFLFSFYRKGFPVGDRYTSETASEWTTRNGFVAPSVVILRSFNGNNVSNTGVTEILLRCRWLVNEEMSERWITPDDVGKPTWAEIDKLFPKTDPKESDSLRSYP